MIIIALRNESYVAFIDVDRIIDRFIRKIHMIQPIAFTKKQEKKKM